MASTFLVLVFMLIAGLGRLLIWLISLAATSRLASRRGQKLKAMSWSPTRGYSAEFSTPEEPQSGNN